MMNKPSPPGSTLFDIMVDRNITVREMAGMMRRSPDYVRELIDGNVEITFRLAAQLSLLAGSTSQFWVKRDEQYRKALAEQE